MVRWTVSFMLAAIKLLAAIILADGPSGVNLHSH